MTLDSFYPDDPAAALGEQRYFRVPFISGGKNYADYVLLYSVWQGVGRSGQPFSVGGSGPLLGD
ncbi:hypothetical protein E4K67_14930 [Desulfosporosinus fructosivorans]|uniref:Uncharacterized protein n=1 Tax=Desulfosporosinus fructosivorans TaxID=2018669 RepID=A0A4Z0R294_9FIRM|nr:hypothetical protein E4K67_14930 [Desulfosporosinus fructosivorans]